jgi:hypothetical protein
MAKAAPATAAAAGPPLMHHDRPPRLPGRRTSRSRGTPALLLAAPPSAADVAVGRMGAADLTPGAAALAGPPAAAVLPAALVPLPVAAAFLRAGETQAQAPPGPPTRTPGPGPSTCGPGPGAHLALLRLGQSSRPMPSSLDRPASGPATGENLPLLRPFLLRWTASPQDGISRP